MLLSEVIKYVLVRTGKYVYGGTEAMNLSVEDLWTLWQPEVKRFQKYIPITKTFNIHFEIGQSTGISPYDFTYDQNNPGYVATDVNHIVYGIPPEFISKCVPVTLFQAGWGGGIAWGQYAAYPKFQDMMDPNRLTQPYIHLDIYRKPLLYSSQPGRHEVTAHYNYLITETRDSGSNRLQEVEISGLDDGTNDNEMSNILLDMFTARFISALGGAIGSFTSSAIPLASDAAYLRDKGDNDYKEALKNLYEFANFFYAIHT